MSLIYLDNNATTMMDPRVCEAMLPFLREAYANPSSVHHFGQQARHAVDSARARIAAALGTEPRRIALVSGGTEANNLAIRGTLAVRGAKRHFVTTAVEHESVRRLGGQLAKEGYRVTCVGVDGAGRIDPDAFAAALTEETALASVIHANNETGVVFPVEVLGRIAAEKGVPLHVDATQAVGKLPVDFSTLPVQLASWSGHKFHGPKGIGGLYVARGARLRSQIVGGHQEHDLRGGTENVAGIVGMAEALDLAVGHLDEENVRVRGLRDRLEAGVLERVAGAAVIGDREHRLCNTTNVGFADLEAEAILMLLSQEEVCASSGSACSSGSLEPSHVLAAMGVDDSIAHGAIRFSLSRFTTDQDVQRALEIIPRVVERLRALNV